MSDGITLLELPSDYKHNKRLDWFLMAATEAEKALKEGDILSVLCDGKVKEYTFDCIGDWSYVWTKCGEHYIDAVNIIKVNGEEKLFGMRRELQQMNDDLSEGIEL